MLNFKRAPQVFVRENRLWINNHSRPLYGEVEMWIYSLVMQITGV